MKANCKINIGLDILRRRNDGYHDLETVMFPVHGLYDQVDIVKSDRLQFRSLGLTVDCPDEDNICLKAFWLMRKRYGVGDVKITLDKRVPFGAGLGGGSADGTAVVMALNDIFSLKLSEFELISCAAELGSDTAFFVRNTPQLCSGRGEILTPIDVDLQGRYLVIVTPEDKVSTREAYAGVTPQIPATPLNDRIQQSISLWQRSITNAFEPHIFISHPQIAATKNALLEYGAIYASMSGSGSAVYGVFDNIEKGDKLKSLSPYIFKM